jgi:RNA polymerase sigma-70 factor (ECF subfamily)
MEKADRVRLALQGLPERQRSALLLCHYQGLSNRDAATVLDISVDALESLLARARRRLKEELLSNDES